MEVVTVEGDLLDQPVDAIVNAWTRNVIPWWLLLPQGVAGRIRRRAGVRPFVELGRLGPIPLGGAVHTSAGRLPHRAIIHVAGINLLWRASARPIHDAAVNGARLAEHLGLRTVAFPVIGGSTGGFDAAEAERIMRAAFAWIVSDVRVTLVRYRPADTRRR